MPPKLFGLAILLALLACASAQTMITDCTGLQNMNLDLAGNYALANNIDCSDTVNWNSGAGLDPVGRYIPTPFKGTLNGNGYDILNLTINRPTENYIGLFGVVGDSARVTDIGLLWANLEGKGNVGSLAGRNLGIIQGSYSVGQVSGSTEVGGLVGFNNGTIMRSHAVIQPLSASGGSRKGGLVGYNYRQGLVAHSYAAGRLLGTASIVGGLVGYNYFGSITYCYASADIDGGQSTGGLVGENDRGLVASSYAVGAVSASGSDAGGLMGSNNEGTLLENYATGNVVSSASNVGGLVGKNINGGSITQAYATGNVSGAVSDIGGLVGYNSGSLVAQSYATGKVSGAGSFVSGLVGNNNAGTVAQSYWDVETTGQFANAGARVYYNKTTAEMFSKATYAGWDFNCTWLIDEGNNYPQLTSNLCANRTIPVDNCIDLQSAVFQVQASTILTTTIDCSDTVHWEGGDGFSPGALAEGGIDGDGYYITGLSINRPTTDRVGLFGYTSRSADIRNIGIENVAIVGGNRVGSLVGNNNGVITQAYATGSVASSSSLTHIGGLVGINEGNITTSHSSASVSGIQKVGGLVGKNERGRVIKSHATGTVSATSSYVGGLVGENFESFVTQSYATGQVSSSFGSRVGGLVGYNEGSVLVSYARGSVSSSSSSNAIGGLVGDNYYGAVEETYATGNIISSSSTTGGLVGNNFGGIISKSYWDKQTTGESTSSTTDPSYGKTTAEMYSEATYIDWNFDTTWQINQGFDYPELDIRSTETPMPTQSPEPTPTPPPTQSPEPTFSPGITHSQTPSSVPTPSPSSGKGSNNGSSTLIIGAAAGASAVVVLGAAAGLIFYRQRNGGSNGRNARELM